MNEEPLDIEDRVAVIERDIAILKAVQGHFKIPSQILVMLWSVLLLAGSAVAFVVRLDAKVSALSDAIKTNQQAIEHHIEQPWHAAAGEKYNAIDERERHLESRVDRLDGGR